MLDFLKRLGGGGKEKKDSVPPTAETSTFTPQYFSEVRCREIADSLARLDSIGITDTSSATADQLSVDFSRDGQYYRAVFNVSQEPNSTNYTLTATVSDAHGKQIFQKVRRDVDFLQMQPAIVYVFHDAFVARSD